MNEGKRQRPNWDQYLMAFAHLASTRSHDPDTKHGAVVVDADHRILGIGYNGFPRGGDESKYPCQRPAKYPYMVHAELNAILNCTLRPAGGTIYITGLPCPHCMLTIIQAGIVEVVFGGRQSKMVGDEQQQTVELMAKNHGLSMRELTDAPIDAINAAMDSCQRPQ